MHVPLPLRLALFYTLVLGIGLWSFGYIVYTQAEQRAYHDLDTTLSSRAASVRLGKDILAGYPGISNDGPRLLNSVDALGTGGVAIEVLSVQDNQFTLLATTTGDHENGQSSVTSTVSSPIPWDKQAIHFLAQHQDSTGGVYSIINYQDQRVRVYTLLNTDFGTNHFIQTARSEQDIEQSLSDVRLLLLRGSALVMAFALIGGWAITWGVLARVRSITHTAQNIRVSRNFSKRVFSASPLGRDELTALADAFNQMLASLEEAYQQQQRFLADASHELRAPITSIRCNLDLLAKAPDLPIEEVQDALTDARAEIARMGRLVNDLLLLAHTDVVQHSTEFIEIGYKNMHIIDLDSLLLEVFRQYRPLEQVERQAGPHLRLQHITPVQVLGDADSLKQALVALLDNALKYTPREGWITLSLVRENSHAVVKVSDTGIGILLEERAHIFERFYRADRARIHNPGGSGLGLAIVQSIVQMHQGSIVVESTPEKGSTFLLRLPIRMSV
ncbi:MAG: HAMP domain-containing sensor histidine kinase [Ktedonobacteraceae bacterium]